MVASCMRVGGENEDERSVDELDEVRPLFEEVDEDDEDEEPGVLRPWW